MTTADSAVRISQRLTFYLLVVIIIYLCNIYFFFIPFIIPAPLSRSLPVVTQIRGHIAGPPPPSPLRHVLSFLPRRESSIFFPGRLASNQPTLLGALSSSSLFFFAFLQIKSNLIVVGVELKDNQTLVVFEGETTISNRPPGRPADN